MAGPVATTGAMVQISLDLTSISAAPAVAMSQCKLACNGSKRALHSFSPRGCGYQRAA